MRLPQNAPPRKKFQLPRHIVVIIVAFIAILFAVILWFVYPKTHLHTGAAEFDESPDEIGNLYLRHEVNKSPNNLKLRLRLIHQELALGKLKDAHVLIQPYLVKTPQTDLSWQFQWYAYQIDFIKATAKPEKDLMELTLGHKQKKQKKHKVSLPKLKSTMQQLSKAPLTKKQQIELMSNAVALKFYKVSHDVGMRLFSDRGDLTAEQLAALGKSSYLSGDFLLSAQFYMSAFKVEKLSKVQKQVYIAAINSLLAGNLLPQQFPLIVKQSKQFKNDQQVLMVLAKAALASKKPQLASHWMRQAIGLQYVTSRGGD
ncbi:MAG: hypothetical protein P1U40_11730 [Coxiellaceae bacterium]|nr:hypothetical protein [Coxiellaceae bacterium]